MISTRMENLRPYVPGEQPSDKSYIKLNANENPYSQCDSVVSAVCNFVRAHPQKLSLYPDPDSTLLKNAVAAMLNRTGGVLSRAQCCGAQCTPSSQDALPFAVTPEMIYCGNGSDEVLSFLFYAFFDSSARLVLPEFTYSFYPVYAGFYNMPLDVVPLYDDLRLDVQEMSARAKRNNSGMIFANPNAPTGRALSRDEVRAMLQRANSDKAFIVDEAYVDFGGESCIALLKEFPNLIIVRTFSKSMCGAGLRLGYIVASPEIIKTVTTVKNSFNHFPIDAVAQVAGVAACENDAYYCSCAKKICAAREKFSAFLRTRGWDVVPSSANFVFARKKGVAGKTAYETIKSRGILVRHFATKGIEDYIRITIGTSEQMAALCNVMETL
ncbi:MAG: histidinol-phosphate transaminase [Treponema sp.]|nr:histidinol-phosphate transaminase [Treponema sp.]